VVVAGYGWCGKGVAMRAKGLGAKVIVTEVDPVKAMEAVMDGFSVMPMSEAAETGDIFVTVTGCEDVITREHFMKMKDGAICCNAGHFDCEVSVADLREIAVSESPARQNIKQYLLPNGRKVYVIAEGRLVNLAAGDGHPAEIMDMSFAIQALSAKYLVDHKDTISRERGEMLHAVPESIDREVALRKLEDWGIGIDTLTEKQRVYLYGNL
jgi:adenosylhomocysteinase